MEFCTFTTQEEIEEAVAAVKQMEKDLNIKGSYQIKWIQIKDTSFHYYLLVI